jgi:hypothetical protein
VIAMERAAKIVSAEARSRAGAPGALGARAHGGATRRSIRA